MNKQKITALLISNAEHFRLGHEGQANEEFANILQLLLDDSKQLSEQAMTSLNKLLPIVLDAQQRRDTIYLADLLQYELPKIFNG